MVQGPGADREFEGVSYENGSGNNSRITEVYVTAPLLDSRSPASSAGESALWEARTGKAFCVVPGEHDVAQMSVRVTRNSLVQFLAKATEDHLPGAMSGAAFWLRAGRGRDPAQARSPKPLR